MIYLDFLISAVLLWAVVYVASGEARDTGEAQKK